MLFVVVRADDVADEVDSIPSLHVDALVHNRFVSRLAQLRKLGHRIDESDFPAIQKESDVLSRDILGGNAVLRIHIEVDLYSCGIDAKVLCSNLLAVDHQALRLKQ